MIYGPRFGAARIPDPIATALVLAYQRLFRVWERDTHIRYELSAVATTTQERDHLLNQLFSSWLKYRLIDAAVWSDQYYGIFIQRRPELRSATT